MPGDRGGVLLGDRANLIEHLRADIAHEQEVLGLFLDGLIVRDGEMPNFAAPFRPRGGELLVSLHAGDVSGGDHVHGLIRIVAVEFRPFGDPFFKLGDHGIGQGRFAQRHPLAGNPFELAGDEAGGRLAGLHAQPARAPFEQRGERKQPQLAAGIVRRAVAFEAVVRDHRGDVAREEHALFASGGGHVEHRLGLHLGGAGRTQKRQENRSDWRRRYFAP